MLKYEAYGPHSQGMIEAVWNLDHLEEYNFNSLVSKGARGAMRALKNVADSDLHPNELMTDGLLFTTFSAAHHLLNTGHCG